jgi:hypothetical protein
MDLPRSAPAAKPPATRETDEPAASAQPLVAEAEPPLPQRRRFGGLTAGPEPRESALDSIDPSWLAHVSVGKTVAVPAGLALGLAWLAGSLGPALGIGGFALFVAGSWTLLYAYFNHHDVANDHDLNGPGGRLGAWIRPVLGHVAMFEVAAWALLATAAAAWWFNDSSDDVPGVVKAIFAGCCVVALVRTVWRNDE